MKYSTLNKSELKLCGIRLSSANLNDIAECVAQLYGLPRDEVIVIDVRNDELALDILSDEVDPHLFVGREAELLEKIAALPGVELLPGCRISSEGMMGWISFDPQSKDELNKSISLAEAMAAEMVARVSKRVLVYPSGTEVENGEIEDTNTPMLVKALNDAGFEAEAGSILKDDEGYIVAKLIEAVNRGYGTVITTGGVGAEDKDHSVEAIEKLDAAAAAPYIAKFTPGHGRHLKDGIRIGVGSLEHVTFIALPGPNDEVAACLPTLIEGLKSKQDKALFAEALANVLRMRLKNKMHGDH